MLFKKLQYKNQARVLILGAPEAFNPFLEAFEMHYPDTKVEKALKAGPYAFVLAFVQKDEDIQRLVKQLAGKLGEDPYVWLAYPKKSSTRYTSEINRDSGSWQPLGDAGFEGVRQVAIDADWSALRFRQTDYIKSMKRDPKRAMSQKGRDRLAD